MPKITRTGPLPTPPRCVADKRPRAAYRTDLFSKLYVVRVTSRHGRIVARDDEGERIVLDVGPENDALGEGATGTITPRLAYWTDLPSPMEPTNVQEKQEGQKGQKGKEGCYKSRCEGSEESREEGLQTKWGECKK
jgi:hypothetical protein